MRGLSGLQLGQAVDPTRRGAMGRAGVDHAHAGTAHQRHGLARGVVGQAQQRDVAVVQGLGAMAGALAMLRRQLQQAQVGAAVQPLAHLQAGRALVAVDEDERGHESAPWGFEANRAPANGCRPVESVKLLIQES